MPILYFGGGEGETLVKKLGLGWAVEAGNYDKLNEQISKIDSKVLTRDLRAKIKNISQTEFRFSEQLKRLSCLLN